MKNNIKQYAPSIILTAIVILVWQVVAQGSIISQHILPTPVAIFTAFTQNFDVFILHTLQTLEETIIGLVISVVFGVGIAIFLDSSPIARRAIYPLLVTSQTIPMIAIAPLLLVWFGFDMLPKIIIVVLFCFFPISIATVSGFAQIDRQLLHLLKSMGANYSQVLWKVKFPGAMPQFFSGLKIAATYSVTGAIIGEYVGAYQGLGIYLQQMAHAYAIDVVFAIIAVTAMLSVLLFGLVLLLEKLFIPWSQKYKE